MTWRLNSSSKRDAEGCKIPREAFAARAACLRTSLRVRATEWRKLSIPRIRRTHPKASIAVQLSAASVLKFMVEIVETSIHKLVCLGMGGGFVRPDAQQCERGDRVSQRENKRQQRDFHYFFRTDTTSVSDVIHRTAKLNNTGTHCSPPPRVLTHCRHTRVNAHG